MKIVPIIDILKFIDCDFICIDSLLEIINSNNDSFINKNIADTFPYSLIIDDVKRYCLELSTGASVETVVKFQNENCSYQFSLFDSKYGDKTIMVIIAKSKKQIPKVIHDIYHNIYKVKIADDLQHFVDVFEYILNSIIQVTGMDCGGIYIIDQLTMELKLTFARGLTNSYIKSASIYNNESWNYQLVMNGTPQCIDYTNMELCDNDFRRLEGIKAVVIVPIKFRNSIIGVINVGSHSTNTISQNIYPLLEVIGEQLGAIMDSYMVKSVLAQSKYKKEIIDTIHDVVFQVDKDGIVQYMSGNISTIIGFTPDEILGKYFINFIYPEDVAMFIESCELAKRKIFEPLEYRLITKEGSYRYVLTISESHYDEKGNYIGLTGVVTDIHDKKLAEIKLKESDKRFKTLASSVAAGIFVINDSKVYYVNPAVIQILEYPEEEILGKLFWEFISEEDRGWIIERAKAQLEGKPVPNRYELRLVTKNNTIKWVDFSATQIVLNGKPATLGSVFEITEKKRIESELKQSEEKFYKAFHSSPIPMTINTYNDGMYREVNEAALTTFDFSLHEALGKSIYDLDVFADKNELKQYLQELRTNREVKDMDILFQTKNGKLKQCSINSDIFISSKEEFVVSLIVDITQIKQNAQIILDQFNELQKINADLANVQAKITTQNIQLSEEKELLNRILESITDAVIVTDSYGKIVLVNTITCSVLGKPVNLILNTMVSDLLTIECKQSFSLNFKEIYDTLKNNSIHQECILRVNERKYDIEFNLLPLKNQHNDVNGAVILLRDITQKKIVAQQMAKTSKLESTGLLAAGIAHDFNNILTSIVGNLSIVKYKINENSELYNSIRGAETAAFKAKELTQQLLTFSKGGAPLKKLTSLKNILVETSTFVLRGTAIESRFIIADDLYNVEVDEAQIGQVIQNIVINSREAMQGYGVLKIAAHNVIENDPVRVIIGNELYVQISIEDNGVGIPRDILEKVFDPYFTTKPHGTGLGLAVVFSVIKQHGGYIFVDSEAGKGSRFEIYLKASKNKATFTEIQYCDNITVAGCGKVLILEDDSNIQFILKTMLEELGFEIDITIDGEEAFHKYMNAKYDNNKYAFAIMDLTIPGKQGGKDTIRQIRAIDKDFKVIVSSGYSNDPVMSNYSEYGFNAILPKPYRLEDLKKVIATIMA